MKDKENWFLGFYFYRASYAATKNAIMNSFGKKCDEKYIDKPLLSDEMLNGKMTEEEKQKEVDKFFAQEKARRVNWKRNHIKDGSVS